MNPSYSDYFASTHNRDKLLALVQYFPAAMQPAFAAAGVSPAMMQRLIALGKMADWYRIFTRFTVVTEMIEPVKMKKNMEISDTILRRMTIAEAGLMAIHLSCEHLSYFSKWKILEVEWQRWSRLGVIFWFYALLSMNTRQVYQLAMMRKKINASKASDATDVSTTKLRIEYRRTFLGLMKTLLYTIFNLSLHPSGSEPHGELVVGARTGVIGAVNKTLALITPPPLKMVTPQNRAMLGLLASSIDFYLLMTK